MAQVSKLDREALAQASAIVPALARSGVLVFDGDCRFCIAQAARLARWATGRIATVPLQTPGLLSALGISYDAAMSAMHLVTLEGAIYRGLEAAVQALRKRPILGKLVMLYYVPGFKQLGDLGYRLVARYRYALMGRAVARGECDGACAIHIQKPRVPRADERGLPF